MKKIEKILYPTDFSAMSLMGYKYCLQIAKKFGARVDVVHIYRVDFGVPVPDKMAHNMIEERKLNAHLQLQRFAHLIDSKDQELALGVDIHAHATVGLAEDEIANFSLYNKIDLIVMPTKGEHNLLEAIFGSVTTATVAKATCPVLVIPEGCEYRTIENLVYATDLSVENIDHVAMPIKVAKLYDADIHYVHIYNNSSEEASQEQINELLAANTGGLDTTFYDLKGSNVAEGMKTFLSENKIDLLVTYSPPKNFFERLFRMSSTRSLVEQIAIPMMVIR